MISFLIVSAVMIAVAVVLVARPLLRDSKSSAPAERDVLSAAVLIVIVPALATGLYLALSDWQWNRPADPQQAAVQDLEKRIEKLEQRLRGEPNDLDGWILLGKSYAALQRYPSAVDAFQHAYDLSKGENVEAITDLGEALALMDETSLGGKAGELFERAVRLAPNNPKALWYSSMVALRTGKLELARERMQMLVAMNPPENVRNVLERAIQDLNQQLGIAPEEARNQQTPVGNANGRAVTVSVTLSATLAAQSSEARTLFILARDPGAGGPPLAVVRRNSSELPLTVQLSEKDAMVPGRTIANRSQIEIVARLSKSGQPTAQSGDLYGEAQYNFDSDPHPVSIEINKVVP